MLYYDRTPSSYDEAIESCAKYGAHLVEVFTKEEWKQVMPPKNYYICQRKHLFPTIQSVD